MKKLLFLLLFALSSLTVNAQTSTASPKIISIGKKVLMGLPDCGIWLEKDSLVLNTQKQSWLLGYLLVSPLIFFQGGGLMSRERISA